MCLAVPLRVLSLEGRWAVGEAGWTFCPTCRWGSM